MNAPDTLLEALNIIVVGQATADPADEVVLLRDAAETPLAVVAAVPYLRERDLRTSTENETQQDKEEKIRSATAEHYRHVTQTALELRGENDIPYIATGHLFAADCDPSDDERRTQSLHRFARPHSRLGPSDGDRLSGFGAPAQGATPGRRRHASL